MKRTLDIKNSRKLLFAFFISSAMWIYSSSAHASGLCKDLFLEDKTAGTTSSTGSNIITGRPMKGPTNQVWKSLLEQKPEDRNPRVVGAVARFQNFPVEVVIKALFFSGEASYESYRIFLNEAIPLVGPHARAFYERGGGLEKWIRTQYPEIGEAYDLWMSDPAINKSGRRDTVLLNEKYLGPFIHKFQKEHGNEIAIIPFPGLANRVVAVDPKLESKSEISAAEFKVYDFVRAAEEFPLEVILGLFSHKYAEENMNSYLKLIRHLSGGQGVSGAPELQRILSWVLTQYPELQSLQEIPFSSNSVSIEKLKYQYGAYLQLIPIMGPKPIWNNINQRISQIVDPRWSQQESPKIVESLWERKSRPIPEEALYLRGPDGKYVTPHAGNRIEFNLKTMIGENGSMGEKIRGQIKSLIVDANNNAVGFMLAREYKRVEPGIFLSEPEAYWFNDIEPSASRILSSEIISDAAVVQDSNIKADSADDVHFRIGYSRFAAPVSVGDFIYVEVKGYGTESGIILKIERDNQGKTHSLIIQKPLQREPTAIEVRTIDLSSSRNQISFSAPGFSSFHHTVTREREVPPAGLVSDGNQQVRVLKNSGNQRLSLGNPENSTFKASISVGDEILAAFRANSTLGFRYERFVIKEIVFQGDNAIGFIGDSAADSVNLSNRVFKFSDLDMNLSYISLDPWSENANRIPGDYQQRIPMEPRGRPAQSGNAWANAKARFEQFFDDGQRTSSSFDKPAQIVKEIPPWETSPIYFNSWSEKFHMPEDAQSKRIWAQWVLRVDDNSTTAEIKKSFGRLSSKFHSDKGQGNVEAEQAVTVAKSVLVPKGS